MPIRVATSADAEAIRNIYAPFVLQTPATFDEEVPDLEQVRQKIVRQLKKHPWLVAEEAGKVVGYALASEHRERAAYRWSTDVSVYIQEAYQGRGLGRALYTVLLRLLREQGFRLALAGITLPNPGSVRLHESFGFQRVSYYRQVGFKLGAWRDVGWWSLDLQSGESPTATAPDDPQPFDASIPLED